MGSYTLNAEILTKFSTNLEKKLLVFSKHKFKPKKKWDNFWNMKTHSQKQIVGQNNSSQKVIQGLPIQALHILQQDYKHQLQGKPRRVSKHTKLYIILREH
jgi:hypothetical protein